jgi:hypothetical protein
MLRAAMRSRSSLSYWLAFGALFCVSNAHLASAQVRTPPPVVERLEPTSGPPGTTVQVIGRFFRSDQTVLLGDVELPATARLPNRVTVTIPSGATSGHLAIRLADGTTVTGPELRVLPAPPTPVIASIVPAHAPPGAEVRIVGDHFSARLTENTVTIGGVPVVARTATPTELAVIVPTGAATGPFVVTVAGAGSATSAPFTVDVGVAITSFEPTVASPGTRVTIHGTGFAARATGERVFVNGTTARIASASTTEIAIDVPATATTGTLLVDVRGAGQAYSSTPLTVRSAPTITSIAPTSGLIGATVHVRGTGFGTDIRQVAVSVHGVALTLRNVTDTDITAEIASGSSSDHLSVAIAGLPAIASRETFAVLIPVAVSSFSPEQGGPGTDVTITGTGFSTTAADDHVTVTGMPCTVVSATATELHVRIPTASSGPLVVEVRNAGTARTSRPFVMTTPPTVTSFEPASGIVGTIIHVHGTNFGDVPTLVEVTFGGRAGSIQSLTATQIDVLVPQGATSGHIGVSVRLQGTASSATDFRVLGTLSVSSVDPTSAYPGQTVVVHGAGLDADGLSVMFAGAHSAAAVTARTTSEMRVVVPADAQAGALTVRSDDGRSTATTFTLAPTPSGVGVTEVVPACTHSGCAVVVRGYGFAARATGETITIGDQRARVRRTGTYELEVQIPARVPVGPAVIHIDVRGTGAIDSPPIAITAE